MLRLYILFLAFIINTTLTRVWTIEGTWENLLLQSMSMSIMFVFLFYYMRFMLENRKQKKIDRLRDEK
ncbi:hypothetical protein RJB92_10900 [Staphylococcus hominis]|uniref:hypothetical protein n=1 Tax=Staphylococcus TaxID=1279 RepID=UPI0008A586B5|nr:MULTISPECIES: hypothetical protein [Staphylococcus]MCI2872304.1 hypothetical protein [Staphylococcus hominis]MCI2876570.1 hypothetical protein [Staphylococcus hominis]MCI2891683.1 hypothetical protein [Staphylococcus hominis]MDS3868658.1 hypothetical protein [Staphylococcus hominis]OFO38844.1 hypothetical protein HMPREF3046_03600 [Staphylococcus sp. HMSC070D05]